MQLDELKKWIDKKQLFDSGELKINSDWGPSDCNLKELECIYVDLFDEDGNFDWDNAENRYNNEHVVYEYYFPEHRSDSILVITDLEGYIEEVHYYDDEDITYIITENYQNEDINTENPVFAILDDSLNYYNLEYLATLIENPVLFKARLYGSISIILNDLVTNLLPLLNNFSKYTCRIGSDFEITKGCFVSFAIYLEDHDFLSYEIDLIQRKVKWNPRDYREVRKELPEEAEFVKEYLKKRNYLKEEPRIDRKSVV